MPKAPRSFDRFEILNVPIGIYFILGMFSFITVSYENLFPWYVYIATGFLYIIGVVWCLAKRQKALRMLLDFVMITVAIYGKTPESPTTTFYLLFPMITNSFYGTGQRFIVENMALTVVSAAICFRMRGAGIFGPVCVLFIIAVLIDFRRKMESLSEEIGSQVDMYFSKKELFHKPHDIYLPVLMTLNRFVGREVFLNIEAYVLKKEKYFLINSSEFKWHRELTVTEKTKKRLLDNGYLLADRSRSTRSKGKPSESTCMFQFLINGNLYLICYGFYMERLPLFYWKLGLKRTLGFLSARIANLLDFTYRMKMMRIRDFEKFKANREYIDEAIGTMHFIRNKLTSILNVLELDNQPGEIRELISEADYKKYVSTALRDLNDIKKQANRQLDTRRSNLPEDEYSEVSLKFLYVMLSEISEDSLDKSVRFSGIEPTEKKICECSSYDLKIFFTDFVSNMVRYGRNAEISVISEEDKAVLEFSNEWGKGSSRNIISEINQKDVKSRITRKKSHGVASIKEIANRYGFQLSAKEETADNQAPRLKIRVEIPVKNLESA